MKNLEQLQQVCAEQPYPLLFVTVSGAHLYGFPSPDSDYDLRGVHLVPTQSVLGLYSIRETIDTTFDDNGLEIDLVTHEVKKFFEQMLKSSGMTLEQVLSPLVVHTTPYHEQLKALAHGCITRHYSHHYLGFASSQWKQFQNSDPKQVKPLLYVFRVLLTGIHLMRTGQIEANLNHLNTIFHLTYLDDLIAQKTSGAEHEPLQAGDLGFYEIEFERLQTELEAARDSTYLPDKSTCRPALHELLLQIRMDANLQ